MALNLILDDFDIQSPFELRTVYRSDTGDNSFIGTTMPTAVLSRGIAQGRVGALDPTPDIDNRASIVCTSSGTQTVNTVIDVSGLTWSEPNSLTASIGAVGEKLWFFANGVENTILNIGNIIHNTNPSNSSGASIFFEDACSFNTVNVVDMLFEDGDDNNNAAIQQEGACRSNTVNVDSLDYAGSQTEDIGAGFLNEGTSTTGAFTLRVNRMVAVGKNSKGIWQNGVNPTNVTCNVMEDNGNTGNTALVVNSGTLAIKVSSIQFGSVDSKVFDVSGSGAHLDLICAEAFGDISVTSGGVANVFIQDFDHDAHMITVTGIGSQLNGYIGGRYFGNASSISSMTRQTFSGNVDTATLGLFSLYAQIAQVASTVFEVSMSTIAAADSNNPLNFTVKDETGLAAGGTDAIMIKASDIVVSGVNNVAGDAQFVSVAHGLSDGSVVFHTGFTTTAYNGTKIVVKDSDDEYSINPPLAFTFTEMGVANLEFDKVSGATSILIDAPGSNENIYSDGVNIFTTQ